MPAIIIFCILFGLSLQHAQHKGSLFEALSAIKEAAFNLWHWIILFSPYAVFALISYTVGTISFHTFENIAIYLFLFYLGALFLTFWFIPGLIIAFIPLTYKECLKLLKPALLVAIATALSVATLPYIEQFVKKVTKQAKITPIIEIAEITATTSSLSYPFGQIGNLFLYLFIIFAASYFQHPISFNHFGRFFLLILTYFSALGSPSSTIDAVAFLANWINLPTQVNNLYIELMPITRYGQVLTSVMGMAFISITATFAYFNRIKIRWYFLLKHLTVSLMALYSFLWLINHLFSNNRYQPSLLDFTLPSQLTAGIMTSFDYSRTPSPQFSYASTLDKIHKTGTLRVGYNEQMLPFVYFNNRHQLVGYDVAYMYDLAKALGVHLIFVHFDFPNLVNDLNSHKFDIAIGSIYVTPRRLLTVAYTQPYFSDQPAFIVKKNKTHLFTDLTQIKRIPNLQIAVFNDAVMLAIARQNFSPNQIKIIATPDDLLNYPNLYALLWTQEHTQAWASIHKGYASITPYNLKPGQPLFMAFMLRKNEKELLWFLDYWLKIKTSDGFQQQQYNYWLLGQIPDENLHSWSILNNILHGL